MSTQGGCYCGQVRYEAEGDPIFKGMCHCRECQYISGGGANYAIAYPDAGFRYTQGTPQSYQQAGREKAAVRDFCPDCGTHLVSRSPFAAGLVIVKVGSLDNPDLFDKADTAIWMSEARHFHHVPADVATFPGFVSEQ